MRPGRKINEEWQMTFKTDLEREVKEIFASTWKEREGKVVPDPEGLSLGNDAVKLNATVLYADMADSTDLVDSYSHMHHFAAEIYKAIYAALPESSKMNAEPSRPTMAIV
jgi:hypothetical protein